MTTQTRSWAVLAATLAAAGPVASLHASGQPHEHGVTHLEVVTDGTTVAINLRGAGHHLVGFEHAPEDERQHAAWAETRNGLAEADALFVFAAAAGCRLDDAQVTAPATGEGNEPADGHRHDHDHDDRHSGSQHAGHGHHGGHGPHQAHGDGHDHDDGHDHGHGAHASDWSASYRFGCEAPQHLAHIDIGLFDRFPAHAEVRYQRLSDSGQSGGTLTPGNTRLPLR